MGAEGHTARQILIPSAPLPISDIPPKYLSFIHGQSASENPNKFLLLSTGTAPFTAEYVEDTRSKVGFSTRCLHILCPPQPQQGLRTLQAINPPQISLRNIALTHQERVAAETLGMNHRQPSSFTIRRNVKLSSGGKWRVYRDRTCEDC